MAHQRSLLAIGLVAGLLGLGLRASQAIEPISPAARVLFGGGSHTSSGDGSLPPVGCTSSGIYDLSTTCNNIYLLTGSL